MFPILKRAFSLLLFGTVFLFSHLASAVIRDGGVDPANLGQGAWLYRLSESTNHLYPSNIAPGVTNESSMFAYLKEQGFNFVIVKAATGGLLVNNKAQTVPIGSPSAQFTSSLVQKAHDNGLLIFGSNRSDGKDIPGEIAVADYVFQVGADGFIYDAESEWESQNAWIGTNGPALAWQLCSTVRSNWPTKFIAHNPYDTAYLHFSFPFKEFGYWCDAVIPQVYHHAASKGNAFAAIHWMDVNYRQLHAYLSSLSPSVINGETIYWTNSIKPLTLMRDVYNGMSGTPLHPDSDVRNFIDYLTADPNCVTPGGYRGSSYFRSELHTAGQWANIRAATVGIFPNVVNNIVLDDARATRVGSWTLVKTIDATTGSTVSFTGEFGTDTNSFGTNYWKKTQGTGAAYMQFTPNILTAGDYNVYEWHPSRPDASANVPVVIDYNGGSATVNVNQQANAGDWTLLGRYNFAEGTGGTIRIQDNFSDPSAVATVDALKMVFVPPTSVPSAPGAPIATALGQSQIELTWLDNSTNETGFVIARGTKSGGPYVEIGTVGANGTTFTDSGLASGTTYYYVVRAVNYLGASQNSNQAIATTTGPALPVIISQPKKQTIVVGSNATFSVSASGTAPLFYQWLFNGNNIAGATSSNLTISAATYTDGGNYSVTVSNAFGVAVSSNATLTVLTALPVFDKVTNAWSIRAGSRDYVTTGNTERGLCINPVTGHVLVVSRSALVGGLGVFVLDVETGAELGTISTSGINNVATFKLNKIDTADDGVIYAANLTTSSGVSDFVIYRWEDESAMPTVAYSGAPDNGTTARWGDTFSVQGSGASTRILVSGSGATNAVLFTTTDGGMTFQPNKINPSPEISVAEFSRGMHLANDQTFYIKNIQTNIAGIYSYDAASNSASRIGGISPLEDRMLAICLVTNHQFLAGVIDDKTTSNAGHVLKFYNVSNPSNPVAVSEINFLPFGSGTNSTNPNFGAAVDTDGKFVVALDTENGIVAAKILMLEPVPHINAISLLPGNARRMQLNADPGNFYFQASSDFTNWTDLTNLTRTNGSIEIVDPGANAAQRFYRTKRNP